MSALIAGSIDEVLEALEGVILRAMEERSRLGYFAALYRKVTARVKQGIESGFFDDGPRMARLDVVFANRYLEALLRWQEGRAPTRAWQQALQAAERFRPIVLQQLLAGINAHINLDLGIAAAETSPGPALAASRADFDRINEILFSLIDQVQKELGEVSPWIALLDRVGGRKADEIVRFSLGIARDEAWRFATDLAPLTRDLWRAPVELKDREASVLGRRLLHPGWLLSAALWVIRARESSDARRVIEVLNQVAPPSLEEVEARRLARG